MPPSKATSTPDRRPRREPAFTFVGGKGGVGKTTCAAAMAVRSARRGHRTLIISTDPAPSLGDAFRQPLGPVPRPVRGMGGLYAVEVDAAEALERWLSARRTTLEAIVLRGTWLDRTDVATLLRLSLPGIDEIAALLEIRRLIDGAAFDRVVVDTAPTGHLLRMLGTPEVLQRVALVFERMQASHRVVVDALRGCWTPDAADALIEELDGEARHASALLRDPARSHVTWVALPEPMAIDETADALRWLRGEGITVASLLVNRVVPPPAQRCRWCENRRRFSSACSTPCAAIRRFAVCRCGSCASGRRSRVAWRPSRRWGPRSNVPSPSRVGDRRGCVAGRPPTFRPRR